MTDTPRRLLAYCIAVILGAFTLALTVAVFMHTAPGLLAVFPLSLIFLADELPSLEAEIDDLITGLLSA